MLAKILLMKLMPSEAFNMIPTLQILSRELIHSSIATNSVARKTMPKKP